MVHSNLTTLILITISKLIRSNLLRFRTPSVHRSIPPNVHIGTVIEHSYNGTKVLQFRFYDMRVYNIMGVINYIVFYAVWGGGGIPRKLHNNAHFFG